MGGAITDSSRPREGVEKASRRDVGWGRIKVGRYFKELL